jgi:predicted HTH domain antitoxin
MTAFTSENPLPAFVSDEEARLLLAVKLYETGRLSLGQAAAMCGYSKAGFMDVLGHQDIPVVQYPASELAAETAW